MNWFFKKIKNQLKKPRKIIYARKVKSLKSTFKTCGDNVSIQLPVCINGSKNISVGNDVSINAFVHIWGQGGVTIGNDCLIASHVSITSLTHNVDAALYRHENIAKQVIIGNNVWIGTHAVILPGVEIGDNAIVGAGAVVNKNVPANTIVAGVPAKIIRYKTISKPGNN
jgi:maltose O-acetyltransferase